MAVEEVVVVVVAVTVVAVGVVGHAQVLVQEVVQQPVRTHVIPLVALLVTPPAKHSVLVQQQHSKI